MTLPAHAAQGIRLQCQCHELQGTTIDQQQLATRYCSRTAKPFHHLQRLQGSDHADQRACDTIGDTTAVGFGKTPTQATVAGLAFLIRKDGNLPFHANCCTGNQRNSGGIASGIQLIADAGLTVREAIRKNVAPYTELGIDQEDWTEDQLLNFMLQYPILINRPFVVTELGTRLSRPSELVLEILPLPQKGAFTKEDGEQVLDANGLRLK